MKKILLFLALLFYCAIFAQNFCAFDEVLAAIEAKYPELKKQRIEHDKAIAKEGIQNALKRLGVLDKNGKRTNEVYEIPVVVHVLEPNSFFGSMPFDGEIQNWLEEANQIFATTYGNGYYNEGEGNDGGTVFPFKLVLAKRAPDCTATNGIIRYDASNIPNYTTYGVPDNQNVQNEIFQLAPHWNENSYFNIYIVNRIYKSSNMNAESGKAAWSALPEYPDEVYHMFVKKRALEENWSYLLAHEIGHMLGLYHVFEKGDGDGNINPTSCPNPSEVNCAIENDRVCDTAPTICHDGINPLPTHNDTNDCTGSLYDGIQYNIMNYTSSHRKFTPGQRDRALAEFFSFRNHLVMNSAGALAPTESSEEVPSNSCFPTTTDNYASPYNLGPRLVKIGSIENHSTAFYLGFNNFYEDWTVNTCNNKNVTTKLDVGDNTIQINLLKYQQSIRVWIDFNNDGFFTSDEIVAGEDDILINELTDETEWIRHFTIPNNVVFNTNLRMRIKADGKDFVTDPCNVHGGQIEDYTVFINQALVITTTVNPENSGTVTGAGNYQYGEMVTLVAQPNEGYEFVNWTTENGEVITTQIMYYFNAYTNRNIVANFIKKHILSVIISPPNAGTVSGAGTYQDGAMVSLTANPKPGFEFVNWTENGTELATSPTLIFGITNSRTIKANFTIGNSSGNSIKQYQYWYDNDYAENTIVNTSQSGSFQLYGMFSTTDILSNGLHKVNFRTKDAAGVWSSTVQDYFIKHPKISKFQYWFDDDFENVSTTELEPTNDLILMSDLPTDNIPYGFHKVNFRLYGGGLWSSTIMAYIYKKYNIEIVEYWVDGNYQNRVTIPAGVKDYFFDQSVFSGVSDGHLHTITFRFRNESVWSSAINAYFMKNTKIIGYEYWLNDDYASKLYTSVNPTDILEINQNVDIDNFNFSSGENTLHFRAKDNSGKWSSTINSVFDMGGTLGVEVLPNEKDITLYPNPFEDILFIKSKNQNLHKILLFDLSGKIIKEVANINKKEFEFKPINLPSSMYLLMVITDKGTQTFKIIKK